MSTTPRPWRMVYLIRDRRTAALFPLRYRSENYGLFGDRAIGVIDRKGDTELIAAAVNACHELGAEPEELVVKHNAMLTDLAGCQEMLVNLYSALKTPPGDELITKVRQTVKALSALLTVEWNLEHGDFYDPKTYAGKVWANVRAALALWAIPETPPQGEKEG